MLLDRLTGRAAFEEQPVPATLRGTLRPYQVRGYPGWVPPPLGLGACLADDMGLGKTIQTLALVQRDGQRTRRRPVLLICPTSVVGNWQKEAARFTPDLPVLVHHGGERDARRRHPPEEGARQRWSSPSYALLHRDSRSAAKGRLGRRRPRRGAEHQEPARPSRPRPRGRSTADYRIALTGTPVENHVGDLWSIMEFLNPGLLGTQAEFRRDFFVPIQAQHDAEAAGALKRLTAPFILRRLKTDKSDHRRPARQAGDEGLLQPDQGAGVALRGRGRGGRPALEAAEGIQRKGVILATLIEAQAGLQPSRAVPRRQLARSPAARASWPG